MEDDKKYPIAIVTGSGGLIGSQAVKFLHDKGFRVIGIDNDMRSYFFGKDASTVPNNEALSNDYPRYESHNLDIRDFEEMNALFKHHSNNIEIIIHTAAQPSHDWAANEPLTDFSINATGTINLLESTRLNCPKATFIFTSTNKVYGDTPNFLTLAETDTRYEYLDGGFMPGSIDETMSIDQCKHSVFGASKVAADIMCQEYARYWDMNIGIFRGGCLTGPDHAGAELHGFLSYLIKCMVNNKPYTIFGYKGKQVRDNIHSWDLVNMFWHYHKNPKSSEVYNAGGGRDNSTSILEAIEYVNELRKQDDLEPWTNYTLSDQARSGDHQWYISDLSKFKRHYPEWDITISLEETIQQIYEAEKQKVHDRSDSVLESRN
jgi:CDP-paratose 2-epimerase